MVDSLSNRTEIILSQNCGIMLTSRGDLSPRKPSRQFARFVARVIKADPSEKPHLSALSATTDISPVIACDQALLEVEFMRDSDLELLSITRSVLAGEAEERQEDHVLHRESVLDNVQREITEFLGKVMVKRAPAAVSARVRRLLRMSDELESVSDAGRCFGVLANMDFILVCAYGEGGADPELLLYKKR